MRSSWQNVKYEAKEEKTETKEIRLLIFNIYSALSGEEFSF